MPVSLNISDRYTQIYHYKYNVTTTLFCEANLGEPVTDLLKKSLFLCNLLFIFSVYSATLFSIMWQLSATCSYTCLCNVQSNEVPVKVQSHSMVGKVTVGLAERQHTAGFISYGKWRVRWPPIHWHQLWLQHFNQVWTTFSSITELQTNLY